MDQLRVYAKKRRISEGLRKRFGGVKVVKVIKSAGPLFQEGDGWDLDR